MFAAFPDLLFINQAAQGIVDGDAVAQSFAALSTERQCSLLRATGLAALAAGTKPDDVSLAASAAGVKEGIPAFVLMGKGVPRLQMEKVLALPETEWSRTFRFLIALLGIADTRRRARCVGGCSHWWHQDLSDPNVVDALAQEPATS